MTFELLLCTLLKSCSWLQVSVCENTACLQYKGLLRCSTICEFWKCRKKSLENPYMYMTCQFTSSEARLINRWASKNWLYQAQKSRIRERGLAITFSVLTFFQYSYEHECAGDGVICVGHSVGESVFVQQSSLSTWGECLSFGSCLCLYSTHPGSTTWKQKGHWPKMQTRSALDAVQYPEYRGPNHTASLFISRKIKNLKQTVPDFWPLKDYLVWPLLVFLSFSTPYHTLCPHVDLTAHFETDLLDGLRLSRVWGVLFITGGQILRNVIWLIAFISFYLMKILKGIFSLLIQII